MDAAGPQTPHPTPPGEIPASGVPQDPVDAPGISRRDRPNGRQIRDAHRQSLVIHFVVGVSALLSLVVVNRLVSPGTLWVHWAALAWAAVFITHLAIFEKGTMATMGRKRD